MDNEEVKSLTRHMFFKYLPFIIVMTKKVKGTAVEGKWLMMRDQLMNPRKTLNIEKLERIESVLEGLKKREEENLKTPQNDEKGNKLTPCGNATNNITSLIEDYAVNDNQVKSKRDLSASPGERSEITHDLACEHSYALSVASEDSNDFWSTKKTVHKSTNISNDSSFSLVTRLCDNNVTHEALISEIREPNNNKVAKVPRAKTSLKRPCESDKEFRLNEFSLKRSLSKNVVEMVTTEKLIKNATEQRQDDEIFKGWDRSEVEDGVIFTKILNQRQTFTRKHSQAPEYSPSIYQGIYNIAFAKSRRGFIYKCLIQSCQFQTLVKDSLMNHLKSKHENQQWNGFCNICAKKVLIGKTTVLQEFHHMNKLHVQLNKGVDSLLTENISKAESSSETREEVLINLINLRPWLETEKLKTKSEESELKMLSHEALCSLYKCMALTCIFFTTDQGLFLKHLALHERLTSSERENFLSCAYCDFVGASCKDLQEHVDKVHVYDRFQCNRCFYRSCANFNVLVHQFIYHSNEQNIIFECPELKQRDIRAELKEVKKNREKNIPPIVCVFCRGIFFAKTAFIDHLTKHADNLKARCIICNVETSTKTISDHLEKCHNIGLYQCVYCSMGTDTFDELSCHIANNHPSKLTVFCERTEHRYPDGSLKHISPSVIETTCLKNIKHAVGLKCIFKAPNNPKIMRNEENVGKLRHNLIIHENDQYSSAKPTNQQLLSKIIRPIGEDKTFF